MRLIIPLTGLTLVASFERTPPTSRRWRMSVRFLMIATVLIALLVWLGKETAIHRTIGTDIVVTYPVADLVSDRSRASTYHDLEAIAGAIRSSVPDDEWWPGPRSVIPFYLSSSLIVRDTKKGHARILAWLQEQRSQRNHHTK